MAATTRQTVKHTAPPNPSDLPSRQARLGEQSLESGVGTQRGRERVDAHECARGRVRLESRFKSGHGPVQVTDCDMDQRGILGGHVGPDVPEPFQPAEGLTGLIEAAGSPEGVSKQGEGHRVRLPGGFQDASEDSDGFVRPSQLHKDQPEAKVSRDRPGVQRQGPPEGRFGRLVVASVIKVAAHVCVRDHRYRVEQDRLLVTEFLSERFHSQYDGTLSVCGILGGGRMSADYVAHFRVLFDYFYPGVLPGSLYAMPEGYFLIPPNPATGFPGSPAFHAVFNAVASNPLPAMEMARVHQIELAYADATELITAFLHVLGYQINGANAMTGRTKGHEFFDNAALHYSGSTDDDGLNSGVGRFSADPVGERYLEHWWEPSGRIAKPFVSLHTSRDPLVPVRSADVFAAKVAAAGASEHLLQRTVTAFGHCGFGAADIPQGFQALVSWVRTGERPPV